MRAVNAGGSLPDGSSSTGRYLPVTEAPIYGRLAALPSISRWCHQGLAACLPIGGELPSASLCVLCGGTAIPCRGLPGLTLCCMWNTRGFDGLHDGQAEDGSMDDAPVTEFITDREIYRRVILEMVPQARAFLWLATADLKDLYIRAPRRLRALPPGPRRTARRRRRGSSAAREGARPELPCRLQGHRSPSGVSCRGARRL